MKSTRVLLAAGAVVVLGACSSAVPEAKGGASTVTTTTIDEIIEDLPDPYELVLDSCGEYTRGTLTSHRDYATTVTLEVILFSGSNQSGNIVNSSPVFVKTRPGRTTEWESYNWGDDFASCAVDIDDEYDF